LAKDNLFLISKIMAVTKEKKDQVLADLVEKMKGAKSVVFSKFNKFTVKDMDKLRKKLEDEGVSYKVAKKTLIKLAAKQAGYGDIPKDAMEGNVAVAFSMKDEVAAARIIYQVSKKNEGLTLLGSIFEGKLLSVADTKVLATLPGKQELLTKLVFVMKSPIQGFHGVLKNTVSGLVRVLNGIKDKK